MEYNNVDVRRQDRLLSEDEARKLLSTGEYGVLSMTDGTKQEAVAYGIPVNYVWDGQDALYIHCAKEGRKLRCIALNTHVSFCVVGPTHVVPDKFTTAYQSVILECQAETGLSEDERRKALLMILDKYSHDYTEIGKTYAERSFARTEVIKLRVIKCSGKSKRMPH
ncbi:MAG TPA: 5-nitroimidazole antibiotic resistance protein [Prevotella sp.]|nr:5-nitroimidazole antibiotic resistance protein [Prevotella sp.]